MPERSQKKISVINGSPKKDKSFTMIVTNAFVKGIEQEGGVAELINISDLDITPCRGCLSCWGRTAGECVIKGDDIPMLREKLKAADRIVISFPLFFFGMLLIHDMYHYVSKLRIKLHPCLLYKFCSYKMIRNRLPISFL